jgi:hypothetical protein
MYLWDQSHHLFFVLGIGVTLIELGRTVLDSMISNREVVMQSDIIQKFCELMLCRIERDDKKLWNFVPGYSHKQDYKLDTGLFFKAAGCTTKPLGTHKIRVWLEERERFGDCFLSQFIRSVVVGAGVRMQQQVNWLKQ